MVQGLVRAEGLVLMVMLALSLAVLGWVGVQMYRQKAPGKAEKVAAPETAGAPTATVAEAEAPATGEGEAGQPTAGGAEEHERAAAPASATARPRDAAALAAELDAYSNMIATLKAQLEMTQQMSSQKQHAAHAEMQGQLQVLREELAQRQTQADRVEQQLQETHQEAGVMREALERAQKELREKDAEILRLRQMIEELSGIEPPMLQPPAYTNAAVEDVKMEEQTDEMDAAEIRHVGAMAPGVEVRPPDVAAPQPPAKEQKAVRGGERQPAQPAASAGAPETRLAAPERQSHSQHDERVTPAGSETTRGVPARVTDVTAMPVTDIDAETTAEELSESPLATASVPAMADAEEYALETASTELAAPPAPPRPEFTPEAGTRPSWAGMVNGGYRIMCAPFMAPYGVASGVLAPLRDDPEQGGTTNYLAFGAAQLLALPFSVGFNSIAGAGSGSMDALQGCLDIITLGTYSGTGAPPYIEQVIEP